MRLKVGSETLKWRSLLALVALVAGLAVVAAACGGDDEEAAPPAEPAPAEPAEPPAEPAEPPAEPAEPAETGEAPAEAPADRRRQQIQASGACGLGTGEAATGEPIKIGAIVTNVPGIDFTWIGGMAGAYFQCVNDNGGINGRPIEFIMEEEQIDPQQIAQLATKLIEQDGVVGLVGNTSIIDCSVNGAYYAEQGFYPIIAGVDQACFTQPNFSAVNMGPYYSSLGGAQAALNAGATGKMVVVSPNQPGFDVINSGVVEFAEQNGMEGISILEDVPIADPAGLAQRLVGEAGEGGGVVLDFTGPDGAAASAGDRAAGPRRLGDLGQLDAAERPVRRGRAERGVERQVPDQRRVQRARLRLSRTRTT